MSKRFVVTAVDRSAKGYLHVHRAGRAWPSRQGVEVEVLDQDDCPMVESPNGEGFPNIPDPKRLGRRAWAMVQADHRLGWVPVAPIAGETEVVAVETPVVSSDETVAERQRADASEKALLQAVADFERANEEAKTLRAKVAELEALLAGLTEPSRSSTEGAPVRSWQGKPGRQKG